jgi:glucokinase
MILAGDIGGTNIRLAVFDKDLKRIGKVHQFKTGNGSDLETRLHDVLQTRKNGSVVRACLAVAGPVIDGVCAPVNIGRTFRATDIRDALGLESVVLINDLVANAAGIGLLKKNDLVTIQRGEKHHGNCAILSPGTGLGESALIWDGQQHRPIASEGGHARFAPTTELEQELLTFMMRRHKTVTFEHVCSGQGIEPLFRFFVERGSGVSNRFLSRLDQAPVPERAAIISKAGLHKTEPAAVQAMQLFVRILGIEASNLTLKVFACGGVYLGGGIPPRILPLIRSRTFKQAFLSNTIFTKMLARVPVKVILNTDTALEGAAWYGLRFDN